MDVILKEDVENLGQKGEIVHVTPGYARNYLFPRTLAVAASKGNIKNLQHFIASAEKKREGEREEARKVAEKLAGIEIKIEARAGAKNRLFGSVTGQQIADVINADMGLKLDKKKVAAGGGIKTLGKHKIMITVYPGVTVEKEIEVVPSTETAADKSAETAKEKPAKKKGKKAKEAKAEAATEETGEIASSGEIAAGEIATSPKKRAPRNDGSTRSEEAVEEITEEASE